MARFRPYNSVQGVRVEAASESVIEGEDVTFTLHRYGGRPTDVLYTITVKAQVTQNGEFIEGVPPQTVTFAGSPDHISANASPGELSKTVTISTTNDLVDEADGAITLTAEEEEDAFRTYEPETRGGEAGWVSEATVAISDDDEPRFSIADAEADESDGSLDFTVTLTDPSTVETSVNWTTAPGDGQFPATPGVDYEAAGCTLIFAPGETSRIVTVTLLDDDLREGKETFNVELGNVVAAHLTDPTATGTIVNDDDRQEIVVTAPDTQVDEGEDVVFVLTKYNHVDSERSQDPTPVKKPVGRRP